MKKLVAIDLSRAYLLARHNFESKKILDDTWLSMERRCKAAVIYIEIGNDFNDFFQWLKAFPQDMWYAASVIALETFRDNMDEAWHYAYSGILREIKWLGRYMIVNGTYLGKGGRPTEKVRNLKRFAEQWAEFEDEEALEFGPDDADYVMGALHLGDGTLDRYHEMADALEV